MKLCLNLNRKLEIPLREQIGLFRAAGFDGFFSGWQEDWDMAGLRKEAQAQGMLYQSIHAPFAKMADFWEETEETEAGVRQLLLCLRACAENEVPLMVAHAYIGFEKHTPTAFGLDHFEKIVREAEKLNIRIAFENTEGEEYLAVLMTHFAGSRHVGFCWDTGHELCYNRGRDMLALYGDRLLCTHLNDNLGIRDENGTLTPRDDLHLMPLDGVADWRRIAGQLKERHFEGPLTFELKKFGTIDYREGNRYTHMKIEEYLALAYARACRVAEEIERA